MAPGDGAGHRRHAITRPRRRPGIDAGWPDYGGDTGGARYSAAAQITPGNIAELRRAWRHRTGDIAIRPAGLMKRIEFEATPILVGERLVLCMPFELRSGFIVRHAGP